MDASSTVGMGIENCRESPDSKLQACNSLHQFTNCLPSILSKRNKKYLQYKFSVFVLKD